MTTPRSTIRQGLQSESPEVRRAAAVRLPELRADEAGTLLVLALGDDDWRVRKAAAQAAGGIEPRTEVATALAQGLGERHNIALRNASVEALAHLGEAALPVALAALAQPDADLRKLAIEVLANLESEEAARAIAGALHDADDNVKAAAAEALSRANRELRAIAVPALLGALARGSAELKLAALGSLVAVDATPSWAVVAPLLREPLLRRAALRAAGSCDDPEASAALLDAIARDALPLAEEAALALGTRASGLEAFAVVARDEVDDGRAMAVVGKRLAAWVNGDDVALRRAAVLLIGSTRQAHLVHLVAEVFCDADLEHEAECALLVFGDAGYAALLASAANMAPFARARAIAMGTRLRSPGGSEALAGTLRDFLGDADPEVASAAGAALAALGGPADFEAIEALAARADARVSTAAGNALAALAARMPETARSRGLTAGHGAPSASAACHLLRGAARDGELGAAATSFVKRALSTGDPPTRRAAVDALAFATVADASADLVFALSDEEPDVRKAAARALGSLKMADPLRAVIGSETDAETIAIALSALASFAPSLAVGEAESVLRRPTTSLRDSVVTLLAALIEHPSADVRAAAAAVIGGSSLDVAAELLAYRATRETNEGVLRALAAGLASAAVREAP